MYVKWIAINVDLKYIVKFENGEYIVESLIWLLR